MTRKFLKDLGLEAGVVDDIMREHGKAVTPLEETIAALGADKKQLEADKARVFVDLEAAKANQAAPGDGKWKEKHDALKSEFDTFKEDIGKKETAAQKSGLLKTQLEADGANPKLLNLIMREFDLEKLTLTDGKITNWEELAKPVKDAYPDVFKVTEQRGFEPGNPPPVGGGSDAFTTGFLTD